MKNLGRKSKTSNQNHQISTGGEKISGLIQSAHEVCVIYKNDSVTKKLILLSKLLQLHCLGHVETVEVQDVVGQTKCYSSNDEGLRALIINLYKTLFSPYEEKSDDECDSEVESYSEEEKGDANNDLCDEGNGVGKKLLIEKLHILANVDVCLRNKKKLILTLDT